MWSKNKNKRKHVIPHFWIHISQSNTILCILYHLIKAVFNKNICPKYPAKNIGGKHGFHWLGDLNCHVVCTYFLYGLFDFGRDMILSILIEEQYNL